MILLYVYHKAGFSYLSKVNNEDFKELVEFLIESKKIPAYFHIYDATPI